LLADHVEIQALSFHQFGVRPLLDEPAPVEDEYGICIPYRAQAKGDDHGGMSCEQLFHLLLHGALGFAVEGTGRLIEHDDRRAVIDGPGDRNALPLPARERKAGLADARFVGQRQPGNEVVRVGELRRPDDAVGVRLVLAKGKTIGNIRALPRLP
jgi:hypothetical protein